MSRVRILVAAALTAAALVSVPATLAEAAGPATCHGVRATAVGKPQGFVQGTARRDVIVSNGADDVSGAGGDDLICITGDTRSVSVSGGSGDDTVYVLSTRAEVGFFAGSGNDSYFGNDRDDEVGFLTDGVDRARTGKGDDVVAFKVAKKKLRQAKIDLGPGNDGLSFKTKNNPFDSINVDLTKRLVIIGRSTGGPTIGFKPRGVENLETNNFVTAVLVGDGNDNRFTTRDGCSVSMSGLAGDDVLSTGLTETPVDCTPASTPLADGGEGNDSCYAATYVSCETILTAPAQRWS